MFSSIGDIVFQGLYSPTGLSTGRKASYAEHARVGRTPRLQWTGQELQVIDLTLLLDVSFCNPAREIDRFEAYRNNQEIVPYVSGTGRLVGEYVVTDVQITAKHAFADGTLQQVDMRVQLKETGTPSTAARRAANARAQARAVQANNPIPTLQFAPPPSPETRMLADIQVSQVEITAATGEVERAANDGSRLQQLYASARERVNRANEAINRVVAELNDVQNIYYQVNGMIASANATLVRIEQFGTALQNVNDIDSALRASRELSNASNEFSNSTAVLGSLRAVRRV